MGDGKKNSWDIKPYLAVGLIVFLVAALLLILYFFLLRVDSAASGVKSFFHAMEAIIIGCVIAYLVNPVVKWIEGILGKFIQKKGVKRGLSVGLTLLMVILVIAILLAIVVPQLISSVYRLAVRMPRGLEDIMLWVDNRLEEHPELSSIIEDQVGNLNDFVQNAVWTQVPKYASRLMAYASGNIRYMTGALMNTFIGFIVAVYVQVDKEKFMGQAKKLLYAILPPRQGNWVLRLFRKSHEIFIDFIVGRVICAVILGILVFLSMCIFKIPYSPIVSVLAGIMSLVPFFGQFITILTGTLIVLIDSPTKAIIFLIIIIILTQVTGNIIEPKVVGNTIGLSPFWIILAILLGSGLFGIIGVFAGVPLFAIVLYVVGEVINLILKKKKMPTSSGDYRDAVSVDIETGEILNRKSDANLNGIKDIREGDGTDGKGSLGEDPSDEDRCKEVQGGQSTIP